MNQLATQLHVDYTLDTIHTLALAAAIQVWSPALRAVHAAQLSKSRKWHLRSESNQQQTNVYFVTTYYKPRATKTTLTTNSFSWSIRTKY